MARCPRARSVGGELKKEVYIVTTSWHSYPKIYAVGHKYLRDLLADPVVVEEKVDGSQFSFGIFNGELKCRSKGKEIIIDAPDKMFEKAVREVVIRKEDLFDGWTYRAEYLQKPKHNALCYDRVPESFLAIYDINTGHEEYMDPRDKLAESRRLGFETVPLLAYGKVTSINELRELMDLTSFLGGPKIEGIVIKNYFKFGDDGKALLGKIVSEDFKEVHIRNWKTENRPPADVIGELILALKTDARWWKAVQHLRERGELTETPQDIGPLLKEIQNDVLIEEEAWIKETLFRYAWPKVSRGIVGGTPDWYKKTVLHLEG